MATFVLVHGACHGGWCWEKVVPLLQAHGHTAHAPDLPGLGKDTMPPANVTLADNVEKISRLLDKMEEPVVLVGHALGGVTIGQTAEARRRKIKALVYVCGLMPPSGKASRETFSTLSASVTLAGGVWSLPSPGMSGAQTLWPLASRSGATFSQIQPPVQAPWTKRNVATR